MNGPWFYVSLGSIAAVIWVVIGLPVAVVTSYNMGFGGLAHLGMLAGTYAICFAVVLAIARLVQSRRRVS